MSVACSSSGGDPAGPGAADSITTQSYTNPSDTRYVEAELAGGGRIAVYGSKNTDGTADAVTHVWVQSKAEVGTQDGIWIILNGSGSIRRLWSTSGGLVQMIWRANDGVRMIALAPGNATTVLHISDPLTAGTSSVAQASQAEDSAQIHIRGEQCGGHVETTQALALVGLVGETPTVFPGQANGEIRGIPFDESPTDNDAVCESMSAALRRVCDRLVTSGAALDTLAETINDALDELGSDDVALKAFLEDASDAVDSYCDAFNNGTDACVAATSVDGTFAGDVEVTPLLLVGGVGLHTGEKTIWDGTKAPLEAMVVLDEAVRFGPISGVDLERDLGFSVQFSVYCGDGQELAYDMRSSDGLRQDDFCTLISEHATCAVVVFQERPRGTIDVITWTLTDGTRHDAVIVH